MRKKYIIGHTEDREYMVEFDYSLLKGIRNVVVREGKERKDLIVEGAYPPLHEIIYQIVRIYLPSWIKSKLHNR